MSRHFAVLLSGAVIIMMLTAGCTLFPNTSGAPSLVKTAETPGASPVPSTPVAAGTQSPGTCTADTGSDAANCGGCGYACPANAFCQQGTCYCREGYTAQNSQCVAAPAGTSSASVCPAGMSPCGDGYCYDLTSSAANCGVCGNMCPTGMVCSASTCTNVPAEATTAVPTTTATIATVTTTSTIVFKPSLMGTGIAKSCFLTGGTVCGGTCVNLTTSAGNCGSCGHICSGLTPDCCNGACASLKTSAGNCGTCGKICSGLTSTCCNGACVSLKTSAGNCGTCGKICSGITSTCCNGACVDLKDNNSNCGSCGHSCISHEDCIIGHCTNPLDL